MLDLKLAAITRQQPWVDVLSMLECEVETGLIPSLAFGVILQQIIEWQANLQK